MHIPRQGWKTPGASQHRSLKQTVEINRTGAEMTLHWNIDHPPQQRKNTRAVKKNGGMKQKSVDMSVGTPPYYTKLIYSLYFSVWCIIYFDAFWIEICYFDIKWKRAEDKSLWRMESLPFLQGLLNSNYWILFINMHQPNTYKQSWIFSSFLPSVGLFWLRMINCGSHLEMGWLQKRISCRCLSQPSIHYL